MVARLRLCGCLSTAQATAIATRSGWRAPMAGRRGASPPARRAIRRLAPGQCHVTAPLWLPDGPSILTTARRDPEAGSIFAFYDLLRVPVPAEGRGQATRLTEAGFSYYDPEPSPDGRLLALRRLPD